HRDLQRPGKDVGRVEPQAKCDAPVQHADDAPDRDVGTVGRVEPQAKCDTPPPTVSPGPLVKARIRARLFARAAPAAWARAGGPLALLRRMGGVWRRGGVRGVRAALRDFALIGS